MEVSLWFYSKDETTTFNADFTYANNLSSIMLNY